MPKDLQKIESKDHPPQKRITAKRAKRLRRDSRWNYSRISIILALAVVFSLTQGCNDLEGQGTSDLFGSGKLPDVLWSIANQTYEIKAMKKEIIERVQKDAENPDILPIAVIDSGVDLAHPDLVHQIAFDVENNEIVGAGYDFMGEDRWASATLINPNLFSFGAQRIENGIIYGEPENPLDLLTRMNVQFWKHLDLEFNRSPELKNSLFKKLNRDNFSILGAYRLVKVHPFDPQYYQELKAKGDLITPTGEEKLLKDSRLSGPRVVAETLHQPWTLNPEAGLPAEVTYSLARIEHADFFWKAMENALSVGAPSFEKAFQTYIDFAEQRDPEFDRETPSQIRGLLEELSVALSFVETSRSSADPTFSFTAKLRQLVNHNQIFARFDSKHLFSNNDSPSKVLSQTLDRIESMGEFQVQKGTLTAQDRYSLKQILSNLGVVMEATQWMMKERPLNGFLSESNTMDASYRRYLKRAMHPYVSSKSADASHGSHVSGVIALAQEQNRIVPVRVTTQSISVGPKAISAIKSSFKKDFGLWLKEPLVFRALGDTLSSIYPEMDFSDPARDRTSQELLKNFDLSMEISFEKDALRYKFLNEVKSALAYVGKRQIKLANISLGISFKEAPTSIRADDEQFALERAYDFLFFEYFKYRLAETLHAYAPQTLFVIASGNDGTWINGEARSALPIDLSSPWLEEYQDELNREAPNNRINNVLGVGSLSPKQKISSFTNIPIGLNTPFILGTGESVLSAIKSTDTESVTQIITKKLPILSSVYRHSISSSDLKNWTQENLSHFSDLSENDRFLFDNLLSMNFAYGRDLIRQFEQVLALHLFLKFPDHRTRMTGTSMATPTVVGIISQMIAQKAANLGVPLRDIHAHPEFSPSQIIDDVFARAEPLNKKQRGVQLSKLIGERKQQPSAVSTALEAQIDEFIERGQRKKKTLP